MNAILHRSNYRDEQTEGRFVLYDQNGPILSCVTLELGWKDNAPDVSCIPKGTYKAVLRISENLGKHYRVLQPDGSEVPGRSWILIHIGNFKADIKGCILVGRTFVDLNADDYADVTASGATLERLLELAPDGFDFEITGEH